MNIYNANGALVRGPENWVLSPGSAPIDLGTIVAATPSVSYPGAVLLTPSGDQVITADNLLPASGNTTQYLGTSANPWLFFGSAKSMNGVLNATLFPGSDIGAQVNAAIAALGSSGGEIYIPAGTYTQTSTIYLPSHVRLRGASATGTILNFTPTTWLGDCSF